MRKLWYVGTKVYRQQTILKRHLSGYLVEVSRNALQRSARFSSRDFEDMKKCVVRIFQPRDVGVKTFHGLYTRNITAARRVVYVKDTLGEYINLENGAHINRLINVPQMYHQVRKAICQVSITGS